MYRESKLSTITSAGLRDARRHWMAIGIPIAILLVIAYTVASLIDEPLRRYTEAKMNRALTGYTARIDSSTSTRSASRSISSSLVIVQDAHPDPPIAGSAGSTRASTGAPSSAAGSSATSGVDTPSIHVDLAQARKEIADPIPVKERGWQDALEAIYPLKINHFVMRDGDVTYVDQGPFKPLHSVRSELIATNIRNVRARRVPTRPTCGSRRWSSLRPLAGDGAGQLPDEPNPTFRGVVDIASTSSWTTSSRSRAGTTSCSTRGSSRRTATSSTASRHKTVELRTRPRRRRSPRVRSLADTEAAERQTSGHGRAEAAKAIEQQARRPRTIDELTLTRSTVGFRNRARRRRTACS